MNNIGILSPQCRVDGVWRWNAFSLDPPIPDLTIVVSYPILNRSHASIHLVTTLCLMHRCVCIWLYILQNYNYKLHFQNLSIYHIPHVAIGTMAAENLDVCSACDPWDSNIQLAMGLLLILISTSWGCPPFRAGHVFPRQRHMRKGRVIYFCQGMMPSMEGWWDEWMDGKLHEKRPRRPLLYVNYLPISTCIPCLLMGCTIYLVKAH
jgi:hypothetical protein